MFRREFCILIYPILVQFTYKNFKLYIEIRRDFIKWECINNGWSMDTVQDGYRYIYIYIKKTIICSFFFFVHINASGKSFG